MNDTHIDKDHIPKIRYVFIVAAILNFMFTVLEGVLMLFEFIGQPNRNIIYFVKQNGNILIFIILNVV